MGMTTVLANMTAPTTITHWEVVGGYEVVQGRFSLAPQLGLGRRGFSIDSTDPSRTPDNVYNYFVLGASASFAIGPRITLRGSLAFEPVVSGTDAMESEFGAARRWAVEAGGAIEARPQAHVFVRAAADVQRFTWSWDMAGPRGAGGATDVYPSGTLSLGAEY